MASTSSIRAALSSNLKLVNDWLGDQDFVSAAEAADGLTVLANVYQYYGDQPAWQEKVAFLRDEVQVLVSETKGKDAAACEKASRKVAARLTELAENPPSGAKVVVQDFKPVASTKTLMKLMGGTYADAKATKSVNDLSNMAYTVAEVANVVGYLRNDSTWQERARELRETALDVAARSPAMDLQSARTELKNVYRRCEACHQAYKR